MFEDFSFTSPSSRPARLALDPEDRLMVDGDSTLISPLSSRCPSPQSHRFRNISRSRSSHFHRSQQPPTSVPFPYDSDHKRLSISTLTQKLHEHTLATPTNDGRSNQNSNQRFAQGPGQGGGGYGYDGRYTPRSRYGGYSHGLVLTPPETDHSDDSGVEGLSSPSASSNPSPTFMPPDLLSDLPDFGLDSHPHPPNSHPLQDQNQDIRMQRQQISRLQCNQSEVEAMQRSLLAEEGGLGAGDPSREEDDCHPSDLPPRLSPRRRAVTLARSRFGPEAGADARARRKSSCGALLSSRVDKSHLSGYAGVGKKRSDNGLRRKSLVSAALASMVERE
ncbi:hypothetical protein PENANT_c021G06773 [Penicillium antarcticum]|uniref:Uncharacterized protein n=1 Tax=Penicillium antarcticum TaxID=416450 RepID=A0A1V6PZS1_9EURO|nr:uncharacterized protein N7508_010862 [Penicillium antarcticum]KAJ5296041.1 hypothetical protein N7508_010862 [Penicillium antarcticum]OQD82455.1 hypothetical protein PENANT_c021G06773 [Penicillium antarcticum]